MSAMDLSMKGSYLEATTQAQHRSGESFGYACNFVQFGHATLSIFALQLWVILLCNKQAWAEAQALKTSTSASLTKALNYVLNRKQFMFTYLEGGRCSLSNNNSENSVRPVTVGRKNWLFSDSQDGAEASMLCYTIIEMAKTYNLKIYDYILFLLSERPGKDMTDEGLDNLSPWSDGIGDRIDEFIKSRESR